MYIKRLKSKRKPNWITDGSSIDMARDLGGLMQRLVYSREELIVSVENILKFREYEAQQSETILGRLRAIFVRPGDFQYIQIDGTRLIQLFEFSKTKLTTKLSAEADYLVDMLELTEILDIVKRELSENKIELHQP